MKQAVIGKTNGKRASKYASSINIIEKEELHWKKRILKLIWLLLNKSRRYQLVSLFMDIFACFAGILSGWALTVWGLGIKEQPRNYLASLFILVFGLVSSFLNMKGYSPTYLRRPERELEIIVKSLIYSYLFIFAFNFIVFKNAGFSRYLYGFSYIFILFFLMLGRFGLKRLFRKFWYFGIGQERALIIGSRTQEMQKLEDQFRIQKYSRFKFIGYIEIDKGRLICNGKEQALTLDMDIKALVKKHRIGTVFIALKGYSEKNHKFFLKLADACKGNNIQVFALSEIFRTEQCVFEPDDFVGFMKTHWTKPVLERKLSLLIKRTLDNIGSILLCIISSPLLIITALAIKLQDRGPVLYKRRVSGLGGETFDALKFRTMVVDADKVLMKDKELKAIFEKNYKLKNDSRVTRLGRILRKLSIDELPQLYNVLVGQMSLVGPRIVTQEELELYGEFKNERIKVRPGISGYWQVSGRQEVDYKERIQMDRFYMYRWNIWMDLWILLKTVQKVLKMEGAY